MSGWTDGQIWAVILLIGAGTYAIRLSFLGLLGGRDLPLWALRLLRYTPVAVIPGLMAPLVVFPAQAGGQIDPVRLVVAGLTLWVGWWTGSVLQAMAAGLAAWIAASLLIG